MDASGFFEGLYGFPTKNLFSNGDCYRGEGGSDPMCILIFFHFSFALPTLPPQKMSRLKRTCSSKIELFPTEDVWFPTESGSEKKKQNPLQNHGL